MVGGICISKLAVYDISKAVSWWLNLCVPHCSAGSPYDGKASDMWAMGVLFYTMLYGQFPFYDSNPQELFKRISEAEYTIPK